MRFPGLGANQSDLERLMPGPQHEESALIQSARIFPSIQTARVEIVFENLLCRAVRTCASRALTMPELRAPVQILSIRRLVRKHGQDSFIPPRSGEAPDKFLMTVGRIPTILSPAEKIASNSPVKLSSIAALSGRACRAIIILLHATRLIAPLEKAVMMALAEVNRRPELLARSSITSHHLLSMGVAWLVTTTPSQKVHWPLAPRIELLVLSWVCLLYPFPFNHCLCLCRGPRLRNRQWHINSATQPFRFARDLFGGRLFEEQI